MTTENDGKATFELNFAIGPAQQFIGAARTTNDFWAGSFVLSWLGGVAMVTARKLGAELVFPLGLEKELDELVNGQFGAIDRQAAALPSKFRAVIAQPQATGQPDALGLAKAVANAVQTAWHALCAHVYEKDIAPLKADGLDVDRRVLWNQQIEEAFDIQWTLSESDRQFERRKHWRTQNKAPQRGSKCMLMPQFQELSLQSTHSAGDEFWKPLITHTGDDLAQGERLCAPALVKRRMRRWFASLPPTELAAETQGKWTLTKMDVNYRAPDTAKLSEKNGFYAVLRMDIDGLGGADPESYPAVSVFAREANDIVSQHKGYTIYSGGDDVLAFVPAAAALDCAAALRWRWSQVQKPTQEQGQTMLTASVAVLICHYKSPMADALRRSDSLLADIAKDATGRDALAVQLCKPGSDVQTYSAPWDKAWTIDKLHPDTPPKVNLNVFAGTMGKSEGFSSGYVYWLRSFYNQVNMARRITPDNDKWTDQMLGLMVTQYLHQQRSGDGAAITYELARMQIKPLISLSRQYVRQQESAHKYVSKPKPNDVFTAQAALIGRFLASMLPEVPKQENREATV